MFEDEKGFSFDTLAEKEMNKAFRYYNYVREFYGYLCDSLDLVFEEGCDEFDPAYAPAEKEFPPAEGVDEMARAIHAYETLQTMVKILDEDIIEDAVQERGMLQDSHKFALTSIAEYFPTTSLWREFDEHAQKQLDKYANDAQSAVSLMEPLSLESAIHKIFAEQKECLERFLPQKIEELKKLQNSHKGRLKYEDRRSQEYIDRIMDLLIKDTSWIGNRKKCKHEDEHHQHLQLMARKSWPTPALSTARKISTSCYA